ncbi:MAG: hypothetical protein ABJE77_08905, partial [Tateyamaria sp.]
NSPRFKTHKSIYWWIGAGKNYLIIEVRKVLSMGVFAWSNEMFNDDVFPTKHAQTLNIPHHLRAFLWPRHYLGGRIGTNSGHSCSTQLMTS